MSHFEKSNLNPIDFNEIDLQTTHLQPRGRALWLLVLRMLGEDERDGRERGREGGVRARVHVTLSHSKKGTRAGGNAHRRQAPTA